MLRMPLTLKAPSRGVPVAENETAIGRLMNVGGEQREVGVVAAVERQFDDLLRVDHLAVFARIGFQRSSRAGYFHSLADTADL